MPRHVDHATRRRDILAAATSVIAETGMRGLSFRTVADRLGGSTTVVTHYFPTMKDLLDELADNIVASWDDEVAALEQGVEDPHERLLILVRWLLPVDESSLLDERARIGLVADTLAGQDYRQVFKSWDRKVRGLLADHLRRLVPDGQVDAQVELLRIVTNGVVLSTIEHPDDWPPSRQLAVVERALDGLGLGRGLVGLS